MMANNTWLLAHEECGRASALVNQKNEMEAKVRLLKLPVAVHFFVACTTCGVLCPHRPGSWGGP